MLQITVRLVSVLPPEVEVAEHGASYEERTEGVRTHEVLSVTHTHTHLIIHFSIIHQSDEAGTSLPDESCVYIRLLIIIIGLLISRLTGRFMPVGSMQNITNLLKTEDLQYGR